MARTELETRESARDLAIRDVDDSGAAARAEAEVKAAVLVAMKYPRNEDMARERLMKTVQRPEFAEAAYYSYPRGGRDIFGPSVNLAREIGRVWGNIRFGFRVVLETESQRIIEAFAWDLESNAYQTSQDAFEKSHQRVDKRTGVTRWVTPDERDLRELTERRAAIQVRNCILRLMPRDLVDVLTDESRAVVKNGAAGKPIEERRGKVKDGFERLGIYKDKLDAYCITNFEHGFDEITTDEIAELIGIGTAIKEDAGKREEFFPTTAKSTSKPAESEGDLNLTDALNGKVETEANSHDATDLEEGSMQDLEKSMDAAKGRKYPTAIQMQTEVQHALLERFGGEGASDEGGEKAAASHLKIKHGIGDLFALKGEGLKSLYDMYVREEAK